MKKRNILTIIVGAALIVIFAMLLFAFQVRYTEVAIVTTFNKPVRDITEPGLYFKWPWPIQRVYKFDGRVQNFEDKFTETYTKDNINLIVSVFTGWKISDASVFYPKFGGSVPKAQVALDNMIRNAQLAVVGGHNLSDFVNSDRHQLKLDSMETELENQVQATLSTNDYGIELVFTGFKKIELPQSVTQSVFDRMKDERQKLISEELNQGTREAAIIKSTADRQAAITLANANATALGIQGQGEEEAAKVLPIFQQNPALANYLLSLRAMQESLNQQTTLILDERTPPFNLFTGIPMDVTTNSPAQ